MRCAFLLLSLAVLNLAAGPKPRRPTTSGMTYIYTYFDRNGGIVINNLPPSYVTNRGYTLKSVAVAHVRPLLTQREFGQVVKSPELIAMVDEIAQREGVEPHLARAVIQAESAFNYKARSHAGALGLMQLMPATAQRFGVMDPFDPKQNITGGVKYLRWLLDYFKGDLEKVVAAYNAGERAVERWRGIPPYAETRAYVPRVLGLFRNKSVQPDPKASGSMALLQKGRGGFEVAEAARRNVGNAPLNQASAAGQTPTPRPAAPSTPTRFYFWRDKNGTMNVTDFPPPPGIKEIRLSQE